jgi:hypothetical protein
LAASRKPFLLRIPPQLLDELRAWAEQEMRSLNGQIEFLLREAVKKRRAQKSAVEEESDAGEEDDT